MSDCELGGVDVGGGGGIAYSDYPSLENNNGSGPVSGGSSSPPNRNGRGGSRRDSCCTGFVFTTTAVVTGMASLITLGVMGGAGKHGEIVKKKCLKELSGCGGTLALGSSSKGSGQKQLPEGFRDLKMTAEKNTGGCSGNKNAENTRNPPTHSSKRKRNEVASYRQRPGQGEKPKAKNRLDCEKRGKQAEKTYRKTTGTAAGALGAVCVTATAATAAYCCRGNGRGRQG